MTLGMIGLSVLGIAFKRAKKGLANTLYHGYSMGAGVLCSLLGFAAIYYNKELIGKPHFATTHGFYGLLSLAAFFTVNVVGTVALHPTIGIASLRQNQTIRLIHKWAGYGSVCACWGSVVTGFIKREPDLNMQLMMLTPLALFLYFFFFTTPKTNTN